MAKVKGGETKRISRSGKKRTSIGRSRNSRPKHKKANKSKYRGQGR